MRNNVRRILAASPAFGQKFLQVEGIINRARNRDKKSTPKVGFILCFSGCVKYLGRGPAVSKTEQFGRNLDNILLGKELMLETCLKIPVFENGHCISGLEDVWMGGGLVTPSNFNPEAPWLFIVRKGNEYVGKVGVNFHCESGRLVASIVTLQGAKGSPGLKTISRLLRKQDKVWPAEFLRTALENLPSGTAVRGVRGIDHPEVKNGHISSEFARLRYDIIFERIGMKLVCKPGGSGYFSTV